jgi:chromatin segregation and condensation protein Rec8/ScpA/Scc1 (kleisin family)
MSKKQYTTEQIDILSNNIYIKSITDKYITFTDQMKIEALKLDSQ